MFIVTDLVSFRQTLVIPVWSMLSSSPLDELVGTLLREDFSSFSASFFILSNIFSSALILSLSIPLVMEENQPPTELLTKIWKTLAFLDRAFKLKSCFIIWASAWDFQQCGILTSVDSDESVQPPVKLWNSKRCSVISLAIIEYSSY